MRGDGAHRAAAARAQAPLPDGGGASRRPARRHWLRNRHCYASSAGFSRAYLHHLFAANEILSAILASIHNVRFYQRLVRDARAAIVEDRFEDCRSAFLEAYASR